jgi:hypothetical protein
MATFISPRLESLCCSLTPDVLDSLMEMLKLPQTAPESQRQAKVGHGGQLQKTVDCRGQKLMLRKIQLYRHRLDDSCPDRFVGWLAQVPNVAPLLTSVRLTSVLYGSALARAFCLLALLDGLEELWLNRDVYSYRESGDGLQEAIEYMVAFYDGDGGIETGRLYESHNHSIQSRREPNPQPEPLQIQRRPFARLKRLSITIDFTAMRPLALLLSAVTRLTIIVPRKSNDDAAVWQIFEPLGTLRQLRALRVHLDHDTTVAPANLRALHNLTNLGELDLTTGDANHVDDDDIASLLHALPRLVTLVLGMAMPAVSDGLLRTVGEALPQLRWLHLAVDVNLAGTLRQSRQTPLFPLLEILGVTSMDRYNQHFERFGRWTSFACPLPTATLCSRRHYNPLAPCLSSYQDLLTGRHMSGFYATLFTLYCIPAFVSCKFFW